jgi:hypothetical protein
MFCPESPRLQAQVHLHLGTSCLCLLLSLTYLNGGYYYDFLEQFLVSLLIWGRHFRCCICW